MIPTAEAVLSRVSLKYDGYFWRDDPSRFPRTTWHATEWEFLIQRGSAIAVCGFRTGDRLVSRILYDVACEDCLIILDAL